MFKDNLLKNKTIVVTGGGSGLGKSMARRFGELGANLVISGRRKEVLEEAAHEFSEKNIDVLTCPGDVRKIEDVETMSKQALDKFGTVLILPTFDLPKENMLKMIMSGKSPELNSKFQLNYQKSHNHNFLYFLFFLTSQNYSFFSNS